MGSDSVSEATYSDYVYWLEKPSWTIDEAAFIFSGLEPSSFTYWSYESYDSTETAQRTRFTSMLRLIKAAKSKKQLPNGKITTDSWIKWAANKSLKVPSSLNDAIQARTKKQKKQDQSQNSNNDGVKELKTTERNSILKLILGMAVAGYQYDPKQVRNNAIGDIYSDLERLGIPLDQNTIRKWLKEALETHSMKTDN